MFLVLELHGGPETAAICTEEDGGNKVFDTYAKAEEFATGESQVGVVVDVDSLS